MNCIKILSIRPPPKSIFILLWLSDGPKVLFFHHKKFTFLPPPPFVLKKIKKNSLLKIRSNKIT